MSFIDHCIIAFFVCILFVTGERDGTGLLLNESDVVQGRVYRMENKLATLKNVVQQQSRAIEQQVLTIQQQGTAIQTQGTIISQQRTIMKVQKEEIRQLQYDKGTGSTYIIWGRKQCLNITDTELVYTGYVGGGYNEQAGSPSQYVCLPRDPDFQGTSDNNGWHMHGAENASNFIGIQDQDVPCSVCRKTGSTSILVFPGKNKCYNGWAIEYHGYLGSGYHGHAAASSYVCVDSHHEYLNAGDRNDEGKLFYPVLAKCGFLQCPPYRENYPLTCVVCSKL
ncbi:short-chain collagen C4-like [Mytilus edulis]|uniref:short-chain collagen C4-like n=1 Tax=Mytilus edulis TaxID=6550 RepID=UPI0039F11C00